MRTPRPSCTNHAATRAVRTSPAPATAWLGALVLTLTVSCAPSDFDELTDRPARTTADAESACAESRASLDASDCPMADPETDAERAKDAEANPLDALGSTASVVPRDASTADAARPTMPMVCGGQPLACMPGVIESGKQACTVCGAGEQTRTRKCSNDGCSWGAWSAWSVCSAAGPTCMLAKVETDSQNCGACNSGKQTRTRTCRADGCGFGEWTAFGTCGGQTAACTPGDTAACSPADSCGQRVCTDSCTWSGCQPKKPTGCLRRRGGTQVEGSNYRCCGGSKWQFCLPSCDWSDSCVACSQGAPDYCEDC